MNNIIHIFYIKETEKLSDEVFGKFLSQIPDPFQQEIKSYKFWQGAQASLLGKIILQFGFRKLNLNYSLQDLRIGLKDRPFIDGNFDFNISHSGDYIICAITQNGKVGIDIEKHRTLKSSIAERYFDKTECSEIAAAEDAEKTFFDLWTLKESAIKCDGRGVEVLSKTHKQYLSENLNKVLCDGALFHIKPITIEKNYSCSVCSNESFEMDVRQINLPNLSDSPIS